VKKIPWACPRFGGKAKQYVVDALDSTWISGGPYVQELEKRFLKRVGAEHGLAVSNGTTALQLALIAAGVGPGDEVIVPGYTFVAPANMVLAQGAKPVFADVNPTTWCLDAAAAAKKITRRTKAIVAVHVYGNVCDLAALRALANKKRILLIEDAAESAFSKYKGRDAGTWGDLGCYSFQATKTITTGEGGFVTARTPALFERMRIVRDHGMRPGKRYWHEVVGFNFRLTNLQAALGVSQLETLDETIAARKKLDALYRERLGGQKGVTLQRFSPRVTPVVWAFALRVDPKSFGSRDSVIERMAKSGIETRPGFYPFDQLPPYKAPRLKVSREVGLSVVSLPFFPGLTAKQVHRVCDVFLSLRRE
jgi:perosamine synthetase